MGAIWEVWRGRAPREMRAGRDGAMRGGVTEKGRGGATDQCVEGGVQLNEEGASRGTCVRVSEGEHPSLVEGALEILFLENHFLSQHLHCKQLATALGQDHLANRKVNT